MIGPGLRDIRELDVGKDAHLALTLGDVVDKLDVPPTIREELRDLSDRFSELGYGIVQDKLLPCEGRGVYQQQKDCFTYTKGIGSADLAHFNPGEELSCFSPYEGTRFYERSQLKTWGQNYPPRINGALYTRKAAIEFLHTLSVMVNAIKQHGIKSLDEADGLAIPLNIVSFPRLTQYLHDKIRDEGLLQKELVNHFQDRMDLSSISLIAPAPERMDGILKFPKLAGIYPLPKDIEIDTPQFVCGCPNPPFAPLALGDALRKLVLNGTVLYELNSAHSQNLYFNHQSITPFADLGDAIPLSGLNQEEKRVLLISQLVKPFNFPIMSVPEGVKLRRIIYNNLLENRDLAEKLARQFVFPLRSAQQLADHLIDLIPDSPLLDPEIISTLVSREEYRHESNFRLKFTQVGIRELEEGVQEIEKDEEPNPPWKELKRDFRETGYVMYEGNIFPFPTQSFRDLSPQS